MGIDSIWGTVCLHGGCLPSGSSFLSVEACFCRPEYSSHIGHVGSNKNRRTIAGSIVNELHTEVNIRQKYETVKGSVELCWKYFLDGQNISTLHKKHPSQL